MKNNRIKRVPNYITGGAYYPKSYINTNSLTLTDKYNESYTLYNEVKDYIGVPVNFVDTPSRLQCAHDYRSTGTPLPKHKSLWKPYSNEQGRVVEEAWQLYKTNRNFIIDSPTGSGKTYIGSEIISRANTSALIICTKEDLAGQWEEAIGNVLGFNNLGVIKADDVRTAPITIASLQSIYKSGRYPPEVFNQFGLVVWDEVHLAAADQFSRAAWNLNSKRHIGLSATTERSDGRQIVFQSHIGPVLVRGTELPMVPKVLFKTHSAKKPLPPHTHKNSSKAVNSLVLDPERNQKIVEACLKAFSKNRNIFVLSSTRKHLDILRQSCITCGIRPDDIGMYVGGLSESQRDEAKSKRLIFATYQMASTGTNIPRLDFLIIASPRSDIRQSAGRVLRYLPSKSIPIIYDIVDTRSSIFKSFATKRLKWYKSVGAEVKNI